MKYESIQPIERKQAEEQFESGIPDKIIDGLLRITYHDPDWEWIQSKCLAFLSDKNKDVQSSALLCLGHLARIHGRLDLDLVMPMLISLSSDSELEGRVSDVLDDINTFIGL